jgi:hypothetical protein
MRAIRHDPNPGGFIRARSLKPAVVSLALFIGIGGSPANEQCEFPNVLTPALVGHRTLVGEFRVALTPPDYASATEVQQHLAFSTVWARLLESESWPQTNGRCRAMTWTSFYPDLRVLLAETRRRGDTLTAPFDCVSALRRMLLQWRPSKDEIDAAAAWEARDSFWRFADPGSDSGDAADILRRALAQIYRTDTVMHALVSVGPDTFGSLDAGAFRTWLHRQQSDGVAVRALRFCPPQAGPPFVASPAAERFPFSGTIAPGTIRLSIARVPQTSARLLRHLVVVGEGPAIDFSLSSKPALEKYCDRQHPSTTGPGSASPITASVRIGCARTLRYGERWSVLYCDPADCMLAGLAERAMAEIAADPDIVALATDAAPGSSARGPYVVSVDVKDQ